MKDKSISHPQTIHISGTGAVSPFGIGVEPLWKGIMAGENCQKSIKAFPAEHYRSDQAAEVDWSEIDAALQALGLTGISEHATKLSVLAVHEALSQAGLSLEDLRSERIRVGLVVGSLCGSTRIQETAWLGRVREPKFSYKNDKYDHVSFIETQVEQISEWLGVSGPTLLVCTACASGIDAFGLGMDLLRTDQCDVVVVTSGDILSEVVHAGFNTVFTITKGTPRPFDTDRDGFVIGEGAGALVLETEVFSKARSGPVYAIGLGYGSSNSAFHLASPSDDGIAEAKAVQRALNDSDCDPDDIGFVMAHGTGTSKNDTTETAAIAQILQPEDREFPILVSSIKGNIGHSMGAAGGISLVVAIKALNTRRAVPIAGMQNIDPEIFKHQGLRFPRYGDDLTIQGNCALVGAFGFGGCNSTVLIKAAE